MQILDPAAGTGTFLAEAIKQINSKFEGQKGIWPSYVENHLIPRLNGFELLMASYAMAHLKLDMLLRETGYNREANQRFKVFLTNSLEEYHKDTGTLFAGWLSEEANQANRVKRDTPVMVVMGNPPYSVSSSNDSDWIEELMIDYKKDLNERNIQPLSDDYIKFIRFAQYFIEKNSEGILAYISNNSFIDGRIHRQMRKNLLECFDDIFILDLHGSSMKNEVALDGSKDENVFDIQQGVSINLFVKKSTNKKGLAKVFHSDCFGKRNEKYSYLTKEAKSTIDWEQLEPRKPYYFFVPKNLKDQKSYESGFSLADLLDKNACGMVTARDKLLVQISKKEIKEVEKDFKQLEEEEFRSKYNDLNDTRDWKYQNAKDDLLDNGKIRTVDYRPFDRRYIIYSENSKGVLSYPRDDIMKHMYDKSNYGLLVCKQQSTFDFQHVFMIRGLSDKCSLSTQTKEASYHFPLYLYPESNGQQTLDGKPERKPNLDAEIVQEVADELNLTFTPEKEDTEGTFAPIDLLDYIYAVLHSPTYREKYKEFLKIDFPRVPYPNDAETFWELVELGGELRQIHLLEHPIVDDFITTYPVEGSNEITKRLTKTKPGFILYKEEDGEPTHTPDDHRYPGERLGKIQINNEQYFGMVPEKAWNFYIGGYQPAEKWLKDRRDRELSFEEIQHYQKIIVALMETDRIMGEIDELGIEY